MTDSDDNLGRPGVTLLQIEAPNDDDSGCESDLGEAGIHFGAEDGNIDEVALAEPGVLVPVSVANVVLVKEEQRAQLQSFVAWLRPGTEFHLSLVAGLGSNLRVQHQIVESINDIFDFVLGDKARVAAGLSSEAWLLKIRTRDI